MAWVTQTFELEGLIVSLGQDKVIIANNGMYESLELRPLNQEGAHKLAMIFRKAARRFEEIGKGLQ